MPRGWASRSSSPTSPRACPTGDLCGVLVQYPGASGAVRDPRPVIEAAHERGALAVVAADLLALALLEAPGDLRRRRRGRLVAALRRTPLLRRSARRLHVRLGRPRAAPARAPGRCVRRRRGPPGLPPRPPDPRAAHPPRQGHVQHLHRPGAARRRRVDVRRLPRPGGAARDRAAHPRPRQPHRRGAAGRRSGGRQRHLVRHAHRGGARPRRRGRRGGAASRPAPAR